MLSSPFCLPTLFGAYCKKYIRCISVLVFTLAAQCTQRMKKAYVFPGQGSQFEGMGKQLYETSKAARLMFDEADEILGWSLSEIMFTGTKADLTQTKVTQPAVFLESICRVKANPQDFTPSAVAGHSLGEITALVAAGCLNFTEGFQLVVKRAFAMQAACELSESTMAAVLGLDDAKIEEICASITDDIVVPANYNSPGQLVISGTKTAIERVSPLLLEAGAKRVIGLAVGGAFHSPLMEPARTELEQAIKAASFLTPSCPVYQNVDGRPHTDPEQIRINLAKQLTAPVRWTQTIQQMSSDGMAIFVEVGGGGPILRGMIRKIAPEAATEEL
jgi:[acyl-carrier-protein] S-malonyltransferase